ncbi:MAG: hypothetical protein PHG23_01680, partial [Candidatus Pacebacteria bacterium]|nr:hypothetical protein [Candidatus Paceibacterota bacterium]
IILMRNADRIAELVAMPKKLEKNIVSAKKPAQKALYTPISFFGSSIKQTSAATTNGRFILKINTFINGKKLICRMLKK